MSEEDRQLREMFEKQEVKDSIVRGSHSDLITSTTDGTYCFLDEDEEIMKGMQYVTVDSDGTPVSVCEDCFHRTKREAKSGRKP